MAKSIMPFNIKGRCYVCKAHCTTAEHHIFEGSNRKMSEQYGLKVYLCRICHRRAHEHPTEFEQMYKLKANAQQYAMEKHGWSIGRWRELFRKDYR